MESDTAVKLILLGIVNELKNKQLVSPADQDAFLEKQIISKLGPLVTQSEKLLANVKETLFDSDFQTPYKYPVIMYASLLCAQNQQANALLPFYYEFASKALKDLKEITNVKEGLWKTLLQKIYQFGILLLIGNRTLLLSMGNLATRVNSQLLAAKARETRVSKLVRIYNCILSVPEQYLSLNQILSLTLIFIRWELPEDDPFNPTFFSAFQKKTQKKLIKKITKYPPSQLSQQLLLNLIKIVLCGEELLFSYFLEAKFIYENAHTEIALGKQKSALQGLRKAKVLTKGKRLFNLIIQLLLDTTENILKPIERQAILYIALKSISGKFNHNEGLFQILTSHYLLERNPIVCQMSFRIIREEALNNLNVHKLKILLNIFNKDSWKKIVSDDITENTIIQRLSKIAELLTALGRRYSQEDLNLKCQSHKYSLSVQNVKEVKSIIFVVVFDAIGKVAEPQTCDYFLLKVILDKGAEYEILISFSENTEIISIQPKKQSRERAAWVIIKQNNKEILKERKQYLRFGQGNFESLVTATLAGKQNKSLQISIDGAFYQLQLGRKSQIKGFQLGRCQGTISSFYALSCQIQNIKLHKQWCECERKTKLVVEKLGIDKYCYKLNHHNQPPILQLQQDSWSLFRSKIEINVHQTFKQPKIMDLYLQLGGLQTIFFVLERLSRSLEDLKGSEEKIVELLQSFFEMLRLTAYLDESYSFLSDLIKCYKFVNPFLFLLIKRNHYVRQSHDSRLLLSVFQLLVYFRKQKSSGSLKPQIELKMSKIEVKLIVHTLANFQIWSNCSSPLQQFVLTLIQSFIKDGKQIEELIKKDLHKELLSSIVLFATSETYLPCFELLQKRLAEVCISLYGVILKQYIPTNKTQGLLQLKGGKQNYFFIERDLNLSVLLLRSLSQRASARLLSQSQKGAFETLIRYLIKCFLNTDFLYKQLIKNWSQTLLIICNITKSEVNLEPQLVCCLSDIVISYVSRQINQDWWIFNFGACYIDNDKTHLTDCMSVTEYIVEKYNFTTPGKTVVIEKLIKKLILKMPKVDLEERQKIAHEIESLFYQISLKGLYRLSCLESYLNFFTLLKDSYFYTDNSRVNWRKLNRYLMDTLFKSSKITYQNAAFVKFILLNLYEKDQDHPLATNSFHYSSECISKIKALAKFQKPTSAETLGENYHAGAYALIEYCRGWPTLYFLLDQGLLTGAGDLPLPFSQTDLQTKECPGGIITFYLSGRCSPLELYLLLNIILYRQLGNRITFLSTLAPVSIYQKTLEYLVFNSNQLEESSGSYHLLVVLLKEVVNSLNSGYIIKAGSVWKEVQKILSPFGNEKQKKKSEQIIQAIAKASKSVEKALEDSKVDKELSEFLSLVLNKIRLIDQEGENLEMAVLLVLAAEAKKSTETLFRRLSVVGSRFFQVSRQHWLIKEFSASQIEPTGQKLTELIIKQEQNLQKILNNLNQKYQDLLSQFNQRGMQGEKQWKRLILSNQHWFELQGELGDLSTRFYELDEKEVGPFGFYKLNIRPAKTDLDKLPYPRRQEYKDLILQKEQEIRNKQLYLSVSQASEKESLTFFESFAQQSRSEEFNKSPPKQSISQEDFNAEKTKISKKEWWCQWVTKRGIYGGKLKKNKKTLQFIFTGHSELPNEQVYQLSTNKCHRIEQLCEWQRQELSKAVIPIIGSQIFTRRYILRHTAFQIFNYNMHSSYFFNLFQTKALIQFINETNKEGVDFIIDRQQEFFKRGFTEKWIKGELSNFQYLCLVNRYSGRTTNDLAQYPVMPWVMVNFNGKDNYRQINKDYMKNEKNLRNLACPIGTICEQKIKKLKMRLNQIDPHDIEIRFLFGTMYSNPTILYNFFIRLEPFTSLHWQHQGRKIDHADRLFSGIYEQFSTVLSSSSDNKQLTPEFYYWPEFLRNRNQIELGRKQKGEEVHSVVLPVWARTPQQFIFKMREVLESAQVSEKLHNWIDLIFGYKAPYQVAEEYDNLYHYQCYQHDIFKSYESEVEIKTAQIAISEFGQIPETLFLKEHPKRDIRKHIDIDEGVLIFSPEKDQIPVGFQLNDAGLVFWTDKQIFIKKAAIPGFYFNYQWSKQYNSQGSCRLISINMCKWISLAGGIARLYQKRKIKWENQIDSKCLQIIGDYLFYAYQSKIEIVRIAGEMFNPIKSICGHHSDIILIRTQPVLDLVVSIDKSGLVLIHELTDLRFFRAFHLGVQFTKETSQKLRLCIHQMGYFILLDHEQTIYVYNLLGEQLLEQELQVRTVEPKSQEQLITDIELMSHEQPIILASTTKGNIFALNFLEIIRFKQIYPFKNYSRMTNNLLGSIKKRPNLSISKFCLVHSRATSNIIHQLMVLYSDGQLVCYSESSQMGKQLQKNDRLKSMGFF